MAATSRGRVLTEQHQQAQETLAGLLARLLVEVLREFFDPTDIAESAAAVAGLSAGHVLEARAQSRELSTRYVEDFQLAEVDGPPDVPYVEESLTEWDVAEAMEKAVRAAGFGAAKRGGSLQQVEDAVVRAVTGRGQKLAADAGREVVMEHVKKGDGPIGYARVVDADPCPFCAMLASRGLFLMGEDAQGAGLYKSNSFDLSNERFVGDGKFKVHDHCDCTMEPVYSHDGVITLPGNGNQLAREWAQIASGRADPWGAWERWRVSGTLPEDYDGDLEGVKRPRPAAPVRGRDTGVRRMPEAKTAKERKRVAEPKLDKEASRAKIQEWIAADRDRIARIDREIEALSQQGLREEDTAVAALVEERALLLSIIERHEKKLEKM